MRLHEVLNARWTNSMHISAAICAVGVVRCTLNIVQKVFICANVQPRHSQRVNERVGMSSVRPEHPFQQEFHLVVVSTSRPKPRTVCVFWDVAAMFRSTSGRISVMGCNDLCCMLEYGYKREAVKL